jgi:hypothetical protein
MHRLSEELLANQSPDAVMARMRSEFEERIQALEAELRVWGLNAEARKYLRRTLDELPALPSNLAVQFAGLLHAAFQEPFTEHLVTLTRKDEDTGTIAIPDIDRTITLPIKTAIAHHRQMQVLIRDARNDRTKLAGLASHQPSERA